MAYKKLIKVSNICQLLDKSKYPATITINGVAVSAKDNAFYVTGTCIHSGGRTNKLSETIVLRPGRYYFYTFNASEAIPCLSKNINYSFIVSGNSTMFTVEEITECYFGINFAKDIVYSGYLKPQLFDLTEMYGAGHEPTTVEEFRQDFPEEMYDYSPHCWLTSYKRVILTGEGNYLTSYQRNLTCKTKNLFDYTKVNGLKYTKVDVSLNDFLIINGNSFTVQFGSYKASACFTPLFILKAGTYTLSLIAKGTAAGKSGVFGIIKFNSDGTLTELSARWESSNSRQSYTFTLDEDSEVALKLQGYGNASSYNNLDSTFTDIMIELGDTATDYVPYGHL